MPKVRQPGRDTHEQPTHYPLPGLPYRITLAVEGRPETFDQYLTRGQEAMKILRTRVNARGKTEMVIELADRDEQILAFDPSLHHRLGSQMGDVVRSDVISEARAVYWCHFQQAWVDCD